MTSATPPDDSADTTAQTPAGRPTAAVIGGGISGLTAAHVLSRTHEVTLFEADDRIGGHAHTHDVTAAGQSLRIDSGFIVHNERTYPHLLRLFAELDVPTQPTEMSMSITCAGCGLQYAGGRGAAGMFAQPWRASTSFPDSAGPCACSPASTPATTSTQGDSVAGCAVTWNASSRPAASRKWEFYLAYREAGFGTGYLDVAQIRLERESVTSARMA